MAEELMVVLKRSENSGFGFSLLGTTGPPHVIYDIIENSPAAECGEVEAGDIIVKVNGTDVHRYTTKEVLKCLRLSQDPVTLELKRDPKVKAHVREHLARTTGNLEHSNSKLSDVESTSRTSSQKYSNMSSSSTNRSHGSGASTHHRLTSSDPISRPSRIPQAVRSPPPKSVPQSPQNKKSPKPSQIPTANGTNSSNNSSDYHARTSQITTTQPVGKARFEAYMMTGDLILNLSRTAQSSTLVGIHNRKVDSLHNYQANGAIAPRASGESTPSSSPIYSDSSGSTQSIKKEKIKKDFSVSSDNQLQKDIGNDNCFKDDQIESGKLLTKNATDDFVSRKSDKGCRNNTYTSISQHDMVDSGPCDVETHNVRQKVSSSSSSTIKSESPELSFSVPNSPISLSTPLIDVKDTANSVPNSPEQGATEVIRRQHNGVLRKCDAAGFRTSKSEDHLQQTQRDGVGAVVAIDIDEDVNSSLNTLLDTRQDSEDSQNSDRDRIVWTYNAPPGKYQSPSSSNSCSSSVSSSPQRSDSPASPTSVSSSVMSSNSGSKAACGTTFSNAGLLPCPVNGDQSVSEAISNISSPDYQDEDNLLSSKDLAGMALSDPSDSDSTILVSETAHKKKEAKDKDHKIVIQVMADEDRLAQIQSYSELKGSEDELVTLTEDTQTVIAGSYDNKEYSPTVSDDGSDVESLHSYHYSPKAVDMPSAIRLAKRLYSLDGFKKSDVSRHLSKNNDFSRAVAEEYLKHFSFEDHTLDEALRKFLQQFALSGETQERERVLVHFSKRYLDCNPGTFNSQDAVHTLTCAIMLLNTDLHGPNLGRKMTCAEFIDNLAELNDGENFPKDVLKFLYQAIKSQALEWALDELPSEEQKPKKPNVSLSEYLELYAPSESPNAIEYKKGYVMRKCCYDSNYKKTPFGKRSWKMFYCTLRDLFLHLHKDEHGFRKNQMSDNVHNAIRIHHALATKATDYTKKQYVFRLQTADQAEFLFQTSDSKELQSWVDTINYVCASFSAPPLEAGVGSQKRFQRPLLPSTQSKLPLRDQLSAHEEQVVQLENALSEHKKGPVPSKGLPLQNYREKEAYLQYEIKRYKTYVNVLATRMYLDQKLDSQSVEEESSSMQRSLGPGIPGNVSNTLNLGNSSTNSALPNNQQQQSARYGYRPANYRNDGQQDIG